MLQAKIERRQQHVESLPQRMIWLQETLTKVKQMEEEKELEEFRQVVRLLIVRVDKIK